MKNSKAKASKFIAVIFAVVAIVAFVVSSDEFKSIFDNFKGETVTPSQEFTIVSKEEAQAEIDNLTVSYKEIQSYDRDLYTSSYQRYEFNGKNYNSIRKYTFDASRFNKDGVYIDPYTGLEQTIEQVEYDHIIPLAYADRHGANTWTPDHKKAFADDPANGVNVNGSLNSAKSDSGPAKWMPEANSGPYCYTFAKIANDNKLTVAQEDFEALDSCVDNYNNDFYNITQLKN